MLITLSCHSTICQSVAEVQLTGLAPLGAVSHRLLQLMKAAVPAESYVIYLSFFIILSLLRCLQAVARQVPHSLLLFNTFLIIIPFQVFLLYQQIRSGSWRNQFECMPKHNSPHHTWVEVPLKLEVPKLMSQTEANRVEILHHTSEHTMQYYHKLEISTALTVLLLHHPVFKDKYNLVIKQNENDKKTYTSFLISTYA